tara:strand:+ start:1044 stop:1421 length:378 start_codon:yes stop_codon:yes gene_type:complete
MGGGASLKIKDIENSYYKKNIWFPNEIWQSIKNYMLGQEYWKKKLQNSFDIRVKSRFDKITDFNRYNHLVGIKALYSKKFISACYHHQKQIYVQFYRIPGFHKSEARMTLANTYSEINIEEGDDE